MGTTCTRIINISNEYADYPPGCVPCPRGNKPGNPGTFEEIHKKYDDLDPKNFEGARIIIKKILSNHFDVTHVIAMSTKSPLFKSSNLDKEEENQNGYKFKASYIGVKKVGYREKYPIMYGDITPDGTLSANFIHTLCCRWRVKLSTQVKKGKYENLKTSIEYRSDDFTFTATLIDPIILRQEGVLLLQFLQAITSRIALGAEVACNRTSNFPHGQQTNIAGAFRYSTGFHTVSGTLGQAGVRVCYHRKQSEQLQMGVEFQSNFVTHDSKARILYQLNVPQADLVFKGFVDSNWRVGAVYEKKLYPIPEASLVLSGILDHSKQNVSVGIGLNIG